MGSIPILILVGVSLTFLYLAIRKSWVTLPIGVIGGAVINSVLFFLFSLSRENALQMAIVIGLLAGIMFTGITVAVAVFFRNSERLAHQTTPPSTKES